MLDSNLSIKDELPTSRVPSSNLTPDEEAELAKLEAEVGSTNQSDIINEMPPSMSGFSPEGIKGLLSRAAYKNYGSETPESLSQLHNWNPKVDFSRITNPDTSTEVIGSEGGKKYRLDPKPEDLKSFLSDLPKDVLDVIGSDIPIGIAQGAGASTAGLTAGLGAGAASGGAMAAPAAMAASMAASGGIGAGGEALRQKIGQYLGLNKDVNTEDVAAAGAINSISPLFFGTGATAKQVMPYAKAVVGKMAEDAIKPSEMEMAKQILRTQTGLPRKVVGTAMSKAGSFLSGISEDVIHRAKELYPQILQTQENPQLYIDRVKHINESVSNAVGQQFSEVGNAIGDARQQMDASGKTINVQEALAPIHKKIAELEALLADKERPADRKKLNALKEVINNNFTEEVPVTTVTFHQDANVNYPKTISTPVHSVKRVPIVDISPSRAIQFRDELNSLSKSFGLDIGDLTKTEAGMNKLPTATANEIQRGGTTINNEFGKLFSQAADNTNKAVKKVAHEISPEFGTQYSDLNDQYHYLFSLSDEFNKSKMYNNDAAVDRMVRNAQESFNPFAEDIVRKASQISGVNIPDEALNLRTLRTFVNPANDFVSSRGATSTSKTLRTAGAGAAMGAAAGMYTANKARDNGTEFLNPGIGAIIGGALAVGAFSPNMMRKQIKLGNMLRSLPEVTGKIPGGNATPYMLMNTIGNEK
jgi:hypothetical protein